MSIYQNCKDQFKRTVLGDYFLNAHWRKFCISDTFKRIIGTQVNWHISTGIWKRIARCPRQITHMMQNIRWNVSIYWDSNGSLKGVASDREWIFLNVPSLRPTLWLIVSETNRTSFRKLFTDMRCYTLIHLFSISNL